MAQVPRELPAGWELALASPRPVNVQVDHSVATAGEASLLISSKGSSTAGFVALMQTTQATDYRGKRIRFSGDLRTREIKFWAGFWFRVVDARMKTLAFDNMEKKERRMPGDSDWQRHDIVIDVPVGAANILYGVVLNGTGSVWADALRIEVVDQSVPLSSKPFAPQGNLLPLTRTPPPAPRNLDFED
jgi:hypothetical protein